MARSWSARARRDFREREEYRKERGEEDRYKKKDSGRREERREDGRSEERIQEDARRDRREERGYFSDLDDYEATLMNIRNAGPDDDVDEELDRLRRSYDFYEAELDKYDADYDELMRRYERIRDDNRRYMMRDSVDDAREEGREIERQQDDDIKLDGENLSYKDLWETREG